MTMLQEKAVQMIQNMSDENVGFLIEIIQRLIPQKNIQRLFINLNRLIKIKKMQAFQELVDTRDDVKKYLPDDFDPDAELEAARKEK